MTIDSITITEYLAAKNIDFKEINGELVTRCLFSGCDDDSRTNERHLYFDKKTGQFLCQKCGEKGNLQTLIKFNNDNLKELFPHLFIPQARNKQSVVAKPQLTDELIEKCYEALPDHIRKYLNDRGIPDELISAQKLGWGEFYGRYWITIPIRDKDGSWSLLKLRRDPDDSGTTPKMMVFPQKAQHTIYGWEEMNAEARDIVICEGEFDRLVLKAKAIPAVTSSGGAGTFKAEWISEFGKLDKIYICYDTDDAGEKGANALAEQLLNLDNPRVFKVSLPQTMPDGCKDITDYFIHYNGDVAEFFRLAKEVTHFETGLRIKKIEKVERPTTMNEWREVVQKNFPDCLFAAEAGISVLVQLLIRDISNPFALVLVDVPSSGKTITINFFDNIDELTYASDKFTPASFISNSSNVKREQLGDIDLLPRVRYKLFLVRDLATIFSKRDDDLNECLGILTRVLDGEGLKTDTGVHGQRQYTGEWLFMILAASTPIPSRIWKMMGSLGSRLFFLSMNTRNKSEDELALQLTSTSYKEKEKECRQATRNMLFTLWNKYQTGVEWNKDAEPKECLRLIAKCAGLLARLRGVVSVWQESRTADGPDYSYNPPIVEKPDRINQLFYNFCRGHALASGREQISLEDLKFIIEIAIDSSPTQRAKLFRILVENDGQLLTSQVETLLKCSKTTALKEIETFKALEICDVNETGGTHPGHPEKVMRLKKDFMWFCSDECRTLRGIPDVPTQTTLDEVFLGSN